LTVQSFNSQRSSSGQAYLSKKTKKNLNFSEWHGVRFKDRGEAVATFLLSS
jgi:hypothetical protein